MTLGGYRTSFAYPVMSSHSDMTRDERLAIGITDGLLRISVGIENIKDLINDFKNALEVAYGNKSMIVIMNNSGDSYPVSLQVPKLFGFYENQLNKKEVYSISDKKISVILKPNEVKVLYSNDKNIFDSFRK